MDNREMEKKALNMEALDQASGGTFMPNKYSVEEYKSAASEQR